MMNQTSIEHIDIDTEVRIVPHQAIELLKKIFDCEWSFYKHLSLFYARVRSKDDCGLTITTALTVAQKLHTVEEYLSLKDIVAVIKGADGETYIVIKKKKYNSLWKEYGVILAFIDLIGSKERFRRSSGELIKLLKKVQHIIDVFADKHQNIVIWSFADSLIVKSTWCYYKKIKYCPESFLKTILELRTTLSQKIGIKSYMIITQGQNYIGSDKIVHINRTCNHFGMLSFGPPFASLFEIDDAVKKLELEQKRSLYIEKKFYYSLNDKSFFDESTKSERHFRCSFFKTDNEFIAVNVK
jgi:hypothetical protein